MSQTPASRLPPSLAAGQTNVPPNCSGERERGIAWSRSPSVHPSLSFCRPIGRRENDPLCYAPAQVAAVRGTISCVKPFTYIRKSIDAPNDGFSRNWILSSFLINDDRILDLTTIQPQLQCPIHFRASGDHRPPAYRSPQLQQPQVDKRDRAQPGGCNACFRGGVATGNGANKAAGGGGGDDIEAVEAEAVPFVRNGLDGGAASVGDADALR